MEGVTLKPDWPDIEVLQYYLLDFKGEFGVQLKCMLYRRCDLVRAWKLEPGHRIPCEATQ